MCQLAGLGNRTGQALLQFGSQDDMNFTAFLPDEDHSHSYDNKVIIEILHDRKEDCLGNRLSILNISFLQVKAIE